MTDPEGTTQEVTDDKFIDEFRRVGTEAIIRGYEVKNRKRLADASLVVLSEFDKLWKKFTGKRYIQTVTTVPSAVPPTDGFNDTQRGDPKSMKYRQPIHFNELSWTKIRRRIGKKLADLFIIEGTPIDGVKRPIFKNMSIEQLYNILGDKTAKAIIAAGKKDMTGDMPVDIELPVEGYWEVQFAPQKDQNDTKDVRLCVDNLLLRFQRMVPVVVNGFHLEDADNAMRDVIKHDGPEGRKVVARVQKYPYTVLRPSSYEVFHSKLNSGNAAQRQFEKEKEEQV